ncbi:MULTISPECIES: glycosyltransferase family 4 protein [Rhodanobacter]|uniref:glycosyltransferase family 4 protein n=1 Tax=Rhodanobacter TaxID=75309 RepID=UPI0009DBE5C7|nr:MULTISPECIES: glycosyltransferase family 4 protein [Rhodanobacter]TAN18116.1 MAG: glycosyltransferase family 1 protein [Rhodanobacter sp.]UJJ55929.1 glycosyltransferase family 4 protein [Rhodanobacter thiooxydans]
MTTAPEKKRGLRVWLPAICAGSGADVFTLRLADALERAGHEPLLQWFDHSYELMPWRLKRVEAPLGIDLVHAGSWQGFSFKRSGIPLVVTEHQYVANPAFAPYRSLPQALYHRAFCERWARQSYQAADAVVTVSKYCAAAMRVDMVKPITVIHNWVDTELFSPACTTAEGETGRAVAGQPFKLLFVGNPSRWKGADLLPAIASKLGSGFEIHCISGLRTGFNVEELPRNVKLLPRVEPAKMPAIYQSVDAALVPTRYEAFGYVALEAMACGLPVVGFASSGTAEVCQHGKTALLAPVDDLDQLVRYAKQLAQNSSLCAQLGAAGRRRAVECFGEARAIAAYANVYRSVLDKGSAL